MSNHVTRIIAGLLALCMIADPMTASAFQRPVSVPPVFATQSFESQALTLALIAPLKAFSESAAIEVRKVAALQAQTPTVFATLSDWPQSTWTLAILLGATLFTSWVLWGRAQMQAVSRSLSAESWPVIENDPAGHRVSRYEWNSRLPISVSHVLQNWTFQTTPAESMHNAMDNADLLLRAFGLDASRRIIEHDSRGTFSNKHILNTYTPHAWSRSARTPPAHPSLKSDPESIPNAVIWYGDELSGSVHASDHPFQDAQISTLQEISQVLEPGGLFIYIDAEGEATLDHVERLVVKRQWPFEVHVFKPGFGDAGAVVLRKRDPPLPQRSSNLKHTLRLLGLTLLMFAGPLWADRFSTVQQPGGWKDFMSTLLPFVVLISLSDIVEGWKSLNRSAESEAQTSENATDDELEQWESEAKTHDIEDMIQQTYNLITTPGVTQKNLQRAFLMSQQLIVRAQEAKRPFQAEMVGLINSASVMNTLDHPEEAKSRISYAIERSKNSPMLVEDRLMMWRILGEAEMALKNRSAAKHAYEEALRFADKMLAGERAPADQKIFRKAWKVLEDGPKNPNYLKIVDPLRGMRRKFQADLDQLKGSPGPSPHSSDSDTSIQYELEELLSGSAKILLLENPAPEQLEQSISDAEQVFARSGEDPDHQYTFEMASMQHKGMALLRLERLPDAEQVVREALQRGLDKEINLETRLETWKTLAHLLSKDKRQDETAAILEVSRKVAKDAMRGVWPKMEGWKIPKPQMRIFQKPNSSEHVRLMKYLTSHQQTTAQWLEQWRQERVKLAALSAESRSADKKAERQRQFEARKAQEREAQRLADEEAKKRQQQIGETELIWEQNWQRILALMAPEVFGGTLVQWLENHGYIDRKSRYWASSLDEVPYPIDVLKRIVLPQLFVGEKVHVLADLATQMIRGKKSFSDVVNASAAFEKRRLREAERERKNQERRKIQEAQQKAIDDRIAEQRQREKEEQERQRQDMILPQPVEAPAAPVEITQPADLPSPQEGPLSDEERRRQEEAKIKEALRVKQEALDQRRAHVGSILKRSLHTLPHEGRLASDVFDRLVAQAIDGKWSDEQIQEKGSEIKGPKGYLDNLYVSDFSILVRLRVVAAADTRSLELVENIFDAMKQGNATPEQAKLIAEWLVSDLAESEVLEQVEDMFTRNDAGSIAWVVSSALALSSIVLLNFPQAAGLNKVAFHSVITSLVFAMIVYAHPPQRYKKSILISV